ncbi:D-alanyl-D-alanine carboxypeptidase family protein [Pedomonas sp. V897]|uniref:D-alanyl-D-alanine carboxypeptidase family protein n=1 Tax=Pedomonas sp. V897 TaxID=3446482 RepID=UPI003EE0F88F
MKRIVLGFAGLLFASSALAQVPTFETEAPFAYLISADTGTVLFEKNADEPMPPSSMGKMMTVYVAFDMIKKGTVKLDDKITVSPETWRAWNNRGSTMFLPVGAQVTVEDLLHGIVTVSGNDACVVLAEGLAGSEQAFVDLMNEAAKKMGLTNSHFANTTGWPDPEEYASARDLAIIALRTINDFPDLYAKFYGVPSFTFGQTMSGKPITQPNRNPILGKVRGADGVKTGHTEAAGYGFTGSAVQDGQRLVMVLNGLPSMAARTNESVKLMEWGFRTFKTYRVAKKGAVVDNAPVWLGSADTVPLVLDTDAAITTTRASRGKLEVKVSYTGPIPAPIKKGQQVANLVITAPGQKPVTYPLLAGADVEEAGFFARAWAGLKNALFGAPKPAATAAVAGQ